MMARKRYGKGRRQAAMKSRSASRPRSWSAGLLHRRDRGGEHEPRHRGHGQPVRPRGPLQQRGATLNAVITRWGQSWQTADAQLASLTQARQFSQDGQEKCRTAASWRGEEGPDPAVVQRVRSRRMEQDELNH